MDKTNAAQFFPLVKALAEGKTIQFLDNASNIWVDKSEIIFNCEPNCYRIKPEPRTFWITIDHLQNNMVWCHPPRIKLSDGCEIIKVQEVL
jgi:hypothetical protein